ncbi:MAG: prepilin-type N-terminal cleavage/methylation domain-containing protein [Candidatus Brocadiia bacterium]
MDRGLTLIEVVVALAAVATALAWLVGAGHYSAEAMEVAASRTEAAMLGAHLAERMQLAGGWDGQAAGTFHDAPAYRWEVATEPLEGEERQVHCRRARLRVFCAGMGGAAEHIEFDLLVKAD